MDRRHILKGVAFGALAGLTAPASTLALPANGPTPAATPHWSLGFRDLMADVPAHRMTRIAGRCPSDLSGALYRNGPARFRRPGGDAAHWFDGDGLIRRFNLTNGEATLCARFVDTAKRRADETAGAVVTPGFGTPPGPNVTLRSADDTNAANISVIPVGSELWALWEAGSPIRIDPTTLATLGVETLRPDLAHMPFLAHPRVEPGGDIWNLGVNGSKAVVWRVKQDGRLVSADIIDLPAASYIHDFSASHSRLIIILQPLVQEKDSLPFIDGYAWRPKDATQVLVLDKDNLNNRKVFELPSFFAFHYGAAWEDSQGAIHFDVCAASGPEFATTGGRSVLKGVWTPEGLSTLRLISLLPNGTATITDGAFPAEFPRHDDRFGGRPRDLTIHAAGPMNGPLYSGVSVHSWKSGASDAFHFGENYLVEEGVFTARPGGSAEMDGWLLVPALNLKAQASELHVFDARHVESGPLVSWRSEVALPIGLHGSFAAT